MNSNKGYPHGSPFLIPLSPQRLNHPFIYFDGANTVITIDKIGKILYIIVYINI